MCCSRRTAQRMYEREKNLSTAHTSRQQYTQISAPSKNTNICLHLYTIHIVMFRYLTIQACVYLCVCGYTVYSHEYILYRAVHSTGTNRRRVIHTIFFFFFIIIYLKCKRSSQNSRDKKKTRWSFLGGLYQLCTCAIYTQYCGNYPLYRVSYATRKASRWRLWKVYTNYKIYTRLNRGTRPENRN